MDNPRIITPPANPRYSLDAIKSQANVCHDDDDDLLSSYGEVAADRVEAYTNRYLLNTGLSWVMPYFPGANRSVSWYFDAPTGERQTPIIDIPKKPLVSVEEIRYIDCNNTEQVLDPSKYQIDTYNGRIAPAPGEIWPSTSRELFNAVTIEFTSGYGADVADVESRLNLVVNMLAAHWYENREPFSMLTLKQIPESFTELLHGFKVYKF